MGKESLFLYEVPLNFSQKCFFDFWGFLVSSFVGTGEREGEGRRGGKGEEGGGRGRKGEEREEREERGRGEGRRGKRGSDGRKGEKKGTIWSFFLSLCSSVGTFGSPLKI